MDKKQRGGTKNKVHKTRRIDNEEVWGNLHDTQNVTKQQNKPAVSLYGRLALDVPVLFPKKQ